MNGQVGAETEINVQDAMEIGQDMRTIVSRHLYMEASITQKENCQDNASPEARCEDQEKNCVRAESNFRTSLAH